MKILKGIAMLSVCALMSCRIVSTKTAAQSVDSTSLSGSAEKMDLQFCGLSPSGTFNDTSVSISDFLKYLSYSIEDKRGQKGFVNGSEKAPIEDYQVISIWAKTLSADWPEHYGSLLMPPGDCVEALKNATACGRIFNGQLFTNVSYVKGEFDVPFALPEASKAHQIYSLALPNGSPVYCKPMSSKGALADANFAADQVLVLDSAIAQDAPAAALH